VIEIEIIDDNVWEPDETFFVKLSLLEANGYVQLGKKTINQITIINDDGEETFTVFSLPFFVLAINILLF